MDDIEAMIETLRILWGSLASLSLMNGPEFLLAGRTQVYHETLAAAQQAQQKAETLLQELGQQLTQEQQRLDAGVKQFGWQRNE